MALSRSKSAPKKRSAGKPPDGGRRGRERILRAAIEQFALLGFDGTTTVSIARAAGVTQPDVHHHFQSKQRLWEAAVDDVFGRVAGTIVPPAEGDPIDRARVLLEQLVLSSAANPELARLIAREGAVASERLDYLIEHHIGPVLQATAELLRHGQREGWLQQGHAPELLLFLVLGASDHLFMVPALVKSVFGIDVLEEDVRQRFARTFVDVLLLGVLPAARRAALR